MESSKSRKKASSDSKKDDVSAKFIIDYLIKEQKKRDLEISKLKKHIESLKKELETYTHFLNENMGYR